MDIELPIDSSEEKAVTNRYILSGDLLAGRVTSTLKADDSIESETFYYHLDHLNSTKAVTNESGEIVVMYEYRAFGEQLKRLDAPGDDVGDEAKYSYGGKELDEGSNLYYFNARYYDATIGRFINVDPVQDGSNWYVYCSNNPLIMVDPTGLFGGWLIGGIVGSVGGLVQGVCNEIKYAKSDGLWNAASRVLAQTTASASQGALTGLVVDTAIAGAAATIATGGAAAPLAVAGVVAAGAAANYAGGVGNKLLVQSLYQDEIDIGKATVEALPDAVSGAVGAAVGVAGKVIQTSAELVKAATNVSKVAPLTVGFQYTDEVISNIGKTTEILGTVNNVVDELEDVVNN